MTKEQAIELAKSEWWKDRTPEEIVAFQLFEPLLCMDFGDYHEAVEKALGRPVWTHEFAYPDHLRAEFKKEREPMTFEQIVALLPKDKAVVVAFEPQDQAPGAGPGDER